MKLLNRLLDIFPYKIMSEKKIESEFGILTSISSTYLVHNYYLINLNKVFFDQLSREVNNASMRVAYMK